jgi:predicted nucleotidyltransferase
MSVFGRSRIRDRIPLEFFLRPGARLHVREMARRVEASAPAVSEELRRLADLGVLATETIGRSLVYFVDERSPLVPELRSLVQKTIGIQALIQEALDGLPDVDGAYIFGSHATGRENATSDVDLLIIGRPDRVALSERLASVERAIKRDLNVIATTLPQLRTKRDSGDPFWRRILSEPLITVRGEAIEQ